MSNEMSEPNIPAAPDTKKPGFLSTSTGKIVAILVGLGVLGVVVGIAVAMLLTVFGDADQEISGTVESPPAAAGSGVATNAVEPKTPAEEVGNTAVFTFRDIFEPLIKTASTSGTAAAVGTDPASIATSDTVTPTASNTLYLDGVVTEDGVLKAQLRYNGSSYTLAAGGAIPNTPWQVLRVTSTSVAMLYGDVSVTLAVGQGITK